MSDSDALRCSDALRAAVDRLAAGDLVAFPTETVWGLAAVARSRPSIASLQRWKGRDAGQPVSVLVDDPERLEDLGHAPSPLARALISAFWPGPLTLVLPATATDGFAPGIAREDGAVGFRCSPHPRSKDLAAAAWTRGLGPLTATSLNRHGEAPAADLSEALEVIRERSQELASGPIVELLEPGDSDAFGEPPSTVLDLAESPPRILRAGAITEARLERFWSSPHPERLQAR